MRDFLRRNHFLLRRLHSLTGIVPVGGFLLFHLYENSKAWQSATAYNQVVEHINSMWGVQFLEIFGIFLPLYFHALYGIYVAADAKHNVTNYGWGRNWAFFFQRVSGLITLFFVSYHIYHFRFQKLLGLYDPYGGHPTYDIVAGAFANPIILAFYIIGVIAAAYHLCNGIYTFLITWGITIGPRSQRVSNVLTNAAFVGVSALGVWAAFAFR